MTLSEKIYPKRQSKTWSSSHHHVPSRNLSRLQLSKHLKVVFSVALWFLCVKCQHTMVHSWQNSPMISVAQMIFKVLWQCMAQALPHLAPVAKRPCSTLVFSQSVGFPCWSGNKVSNMAVCLRHHSNRKPWLFF